MPLAAAMNVNGACCNWGPPCTPGQACSMLEMQGIWQNQQCVPLSPGGSCTQNGKTISMPGIPGFVQALQLSRSGACGGGAVALTANGSPTCLPGTSTGNVVPLPSGVAPASTLANAPSVAVTQQGTPLTTMQAVTTPQVPWLLIGGAGLLVVVLMASGRR